MSTEYAVVNGATSMVEPHRYATPEEAASEVVRLEALQEEFRAECEEWERERPADGLHPSGTNEPWWRWHKEGWKDAHWFVVERSVTPWGRT